MLRAGVRRVAQTANRAVQQARTFRLLHCVTGMNPKMNNSDPSQTSDEPDEYPKVTQADLDRATLRVGLKPARGSDGSRAEASQQRISHE